MRGKVCLILQRVFCLRITPAHAGKRNFSEAKRPQRQDHPRACGEKQLFIFHKALLSGSPPRMRGKAPGSGTWLWYVRITPAHAGKSCSIWALMANLKDHPRACGEKHRTYEHFPQNQGSPPRMRGKVACTASTAGEVGITPAHAGKSSP